LVVVSIMLLLVVAAVPRMRPALDTRRIREAARAVNVYVSTARNRAIENGRPWGVAILRDENLPLAGARLIQVEVPPPYGGDTDTSTVTITQQSGWKCTVSFPSGEDPVSAGLVHTSDVLRLNYQGHYWTITEISGTSWTFSSATASNPPIISGARFQIFRQPVQSSVAPLQLPKSVVVDLWYSGTASTQFSTTGSLATSTPVPTVVFSSTGAVNEVAADSFTVSNPSGIVAALEPIYLMVGRRDRVPLLASQGGSAVAEDNLTNLQDLTNLWLAINPQTGYITCAEMASGAPDIATARQFAREFQSMGGR